MTVLTASMLSAQKLEDSKEIWDVEDVIEGEFMFYMGLGYAFTRYSPSTTYSDRGLENDNRSEPEYEILYKQAVSSEDM